MAAPQATVWLVPPLQGGIEFSEGGSAKMMFDVEIK